MMLINIEDNQCWCAIAEFANKCRLARDVARMKASELPTSLSLTSRPTSAPSRSTARRVWNPAPSDLFPDVLSTRRKRAAVPSSRPSSVVIAEVSTVSERRSTLTSVPSRALSNGTQDSKSLESKQRKSVDISHSRSRRLATSIGEGTPGTPAAAFARRNSSVLASSTADKRSSSIAATSGEKKRVSFLTEVPPVATATGAAPRPSMSARSRQSVSMATGDTSISPRTSDRKKQQITVTSDPNSSESKREALKSAFVLKSMKRQDVDAEDVQPLIEIAYWSPFVEVRRDAAAALASLSRNTANLELLSEVGTLGAIISMLSSYQDRLDPNIARDCAQSLAMMAKLQSVKMKILQAPDGIDCIFSLLHSPDLKLRRTAFEIIHNLVTIDELREVIAKREGFAFMLESCTSKDSRVRCLAAAILNQLAACRDNRFLFYHSTHFETLAQILRDPYMEKDYLFRRELLSFIQLLVTEEQNGRRFVELNLVSTLLAILDQPKSNLQICLLIVSILESLAIYKKNHAALVAANALPRVVQLCFCPNRGLPATDSSGRPLFRSTGPVRPNSASAASLGASNRRSAVAHRETSAVDIVVNLTPLLNAKSPHSKTAASTTGTASNELNTILRPAFTIFCEMAKNPNNREHVIRSKLVDFIASRNLYASSDKRVRRSVITLLTFLICKERERERQRTERSSSRSLVHSDTVKQELSEQPHTAKTRELAPEFESEYKHYIELLARGVVKCLFGILSGNDFSMKVDAIGAIAQLTEDESSRITMCKPQLLHALKEFALHPLVQTRYNIARTIANFAERPENILKLMDEGVLAILVKYVCPISRNNEVLYEATRAIAAMSMVHASRNKLVECGVLGTLIQFCKASGTSPKVHAHALTAIRNLRHDAAALRIQSIYRGWAVRAQFTRNIFNRRKRLRMASSRKLHGDSALASVMERLVTTSSSSATE